MENHLNYHVSQKGRVSQQKKDRFKREAGDREHPAEIAGIHQGKVPAGLKVPMSSS